MKVAEDQSNLLEQLTDAAIMHPDNTALFNAVLQAARKENCPDHTFSTGRFFSGQAMKYHMLQAVYAEQINDVEKEKEEIFLAFENGLGLFDASKTFCLDLNIKPYYYKVLMDYASTTNNNFIPFNFDKEKMSSFLDNIYQSIPAYRSAAEDVKSGLLSSRRKEYARSLGEIEQYLRLLDEGRNITNAVSFEVLDKIECLFILERPSDAINYARQIVAEGRLKFEDSSCCAHLNYANKSLKAILNIARSGYSS